MDNNIHIDASGGEAEGEGFATRVINSRFRKDDAHGALAMPIYRNAAFEYADSETIASAFQYRPELFTYTRISNPTIEHLERKILAASGAESVIALSTGMAAISNTFFTLASAGANIISSPHLFGNTYSFFVNTIAEFGVEVRFVNTDNIDEIRAAADDRTVAFFCELITNPHLEVADLHAIAPIMHEMGIPMVVDTTLIPWCAFDARSAGVDIEVVSTTKYVSGGATGLGGAIIDYGTFDGLRNAKLARLPKPKGMSRFMFKIRAEIARNLGASMAPDTAYQQSLGIDMLRLRFEAASASALAIARHLDKHPKVVSANYPLLEGSPYREVTSRLIKGNPGAMLTLNLSSQEECYRFMDALLVFHRATNLFDNRSLVIHPSSTIYGTFSPAMKKEMGVDDCLVRLSVGLEDVADLIADLDQALARL